MNATTERNMSIYRHHDGKYLGDAMVDEAKYAAIRQEPHSRGAKEDRHLGDLNVREHDEARGSVIRSK